MSGILSGKEALKKGLNYGSEKCFLIGLLFLVIAISGCMESQSNNYASPSPTDQNRPAMPTPVIYTPIIVTPIPVSTQDQPIDINGQSEVREVSGKIIRINGQGNQIKILNTDVSEIWLNGQGNIVYYPKEANPLITDNGQGNEIKTY